MCGRLVGVKTKAEMDQRLADFQDPDYWDQVRQTLRQLGWTENYNTAPTVPSAIIRQRKAKGEDPVRDIELASWGFTPHAGGVRFNAKSETAEGVNLFSKSLRERRALVPVQGWYEWIGPKGKGVPQFIHQERTDGALPVFFFAGLWRTHEEREEFTILTDASRDHLREVHHRQPIIIPGDLAQDWLDAEVQNYPSITDMMAEASERTPQGIVWHEVGKAIGSNASTGAQLIEPVEPEALLF